MAGESDSADTSRIDSALREWRQGDATLDVGTFLVHLADKRMPLTGAARDAVAKGEVDADEDVFEVLSSVNGLVVVSQSCDIVRECSKSEYVEVSPLVVIEDERRLEEIRKRRQTRYAYLPGLADRKLVVDLERTMTVEKAVVAGWSRIAGCTTDREQAIFAQALARKRGRFAFPDRFNIGLKRLRDRIKERDDRPSLEGQLIRALHEIRVQPSPGWDCGPGRSVFWFLLEAGRTIDFDAGRKIIEDWMKRARLASPFVLADPAFILVEPIDTTVQDYLNSYPLDYDDVSP